MTLCVGWMENGEIQVAADSRLTFIGNNHIDYGVKVMAIPVTVYGPVQEGGSSKLLYGRSIGIAISGGGTIGYTIREVLGSAFNSLQARTNGDVAFYELVDVARRVQLTLAEAAASKIGAGGICEVLLTGFCERLKRQCAFQLTGDIIHGIASVEVVEVLADGRHECWFGSGRSAALSVKKAHPTFSVMQVLREVIHANMEDGVGGGIQYGRFENNEFKVFGVEDYEVNDFGNPRATSTFRGFQIDGQPGSFNLDLGRFIVMHQWIRPFEETFIKLAQDYTRRLGDGEIDVSRMIGDEARSDAGAK